MAKLVPSYDCCVESKWSLSSHRSRCRPNDLAFCNSLEVVDSAEVALAYDTVHSTLGDDILMEGLNSKPVSVSTDSTLCNAAVRNNVNGYTLTGMGQIVITNHVAYSAFADVWRLDSLAHHKPEDRP